MNITLGIVGALVVILIMFVFEVFSERRSLGSWHERTNTLWIKRSDKPAYLYTGDRHNLDLSDVEKIVEVYDE